ncbi:Hypothetical predicted protein [Podarcis lilfordi]|uniref:Uncharacterized protein n=1 Tax=Podarcis lilfordi TaxID=74358 RepID=A0AA35PDZ5_9SAUR|nr:Hypothetical predicted protein [Podarcis lilfordi]
MAGVVANRNEQDPGLFAENILLCTSDCITAGKILRTELEQFSRVSGMQVTFKKAETWVNA